MRGPPLVGEVEAATGATTVGVTATVGVVAVSAALATRGPSRAQAKATAVSTTKNFGAPLVSAGRAPARRGPEFGTSIWGQSPGRTEAVDRHQKNALFIS